MRQLYTYTEQELLQGCQRGDAALQQALYRSFYRKMFGVCLRYTDNRDDAEDVLQEGFIRVFRYIGKFRGEGSLEGWIRRIMVRAAIEHYRQRSRMFMVELDHVREAAPDTDVLSKLSREELLEVIRGLPPGYRTVLNLYAIEGYTHVEIAAMLGISEGTSKSQFSRAKTLLAERLAALESRGLQQSGA